MTRKYRVKKYSNYNDNHTVVIADSSTLPTAIDETGEPIRKRSRIVTPRPKDITPSVTSIDMAYNQRREVEIKHKPQLAESFKEFERRSGIRFTSYNESVG